MVDDLEEEYAQRSARDGARVARAWYRAQVLRSLPHLLRRRLSASRGRSVREGRSGFGDGTLQDVKFALRSLRRSPAFGVVTTATLAIAFGANMALFGVVNALLLRSVPGISEPAGLVEISRDVDGAYFDMSYPVLERLSGSGVLEGLAPVASGRVAVSVAGDPAVAASLSVTASYFDVLGQSPAAGRFFRPEEASWPSVRNVVVVSHRFWRERLGGSSDALGSALRLNGVPVEVIGVAAPGFTGHGPLVMDVFVPLGLDVPGLRSSGELAGIENGVLEALGRPGPGLDARAVRDELTATADRLLVEAAGSEPGTYRVRVEPWAPLPSVARGPVRAFFAVLLTVVGLVLAIACVNVAGLLLARSSERSGELSVRAALGASGGRIARQLLTETAVLFALAGAAGVVLSRWALRVLLAFEPPLPAGFAIELDTRLDARSLAWAAGLTLTAAFLTNLAAASRARRLDIAGVLRRTSRGAGRTRLQRGLVGAQMAGSLVLLVVAALFTRSLASMRGMDPGWDATGVLVASFDLELTGTADAQGLAFYRELADRVRSAPGVESAGLSAKLPLAGFSSFGDVQVDGVAPPEGRSGHPAYVGRVSPGYFETLRIEVLEGRTFDGRDREGAERVAIVNRAMADRFWPAGDAVGATFRVGGERGASHTVVGIVENASYRQLVEDTPNFYYVPGEQHYNAAMSLFVRAAPGMERQAADGILQAARAIQPGLPVQPPGRLSDQLRFALLPQRLAAWVAGVMGALGLLMGAVGIYGVTALAVRNRQREIGVRLALGAAPGALFTRIVGQGMTAPLIGAGIGLAVSMALARLIGAFIPGVSAFDLAAFSGALALLLSVALVAAALPVGRAMRKDPVRTLRTD